MANLIFLYNDNVAAGPFIASDFDGTAQASENFDSGFSTLTCATATATRIYAYDANLEMIRVWDSVTKAQITSEESSPNSPGDNYRGMYHTDTHLVLINDTLDWAEHYLLTDLSYDSGSTYTLPQGTYTAACRGGDYAWIGNNSGDVVERRDLDGSNPVEYDPLINIILHTIFATEDRVHFVNQSTGATTAIDFDGTLQSGDNLALGSGRWRASFVLFEEATADITIATDQAKIYEGDSVDFDIVLPESSTTFVQADVTITGGTITGLTGSGTDYVLTVTAGSGAGNIVISIAEDVITEGNAAVEETFTRNANTTPAAPTIVVTPSTTSASVAVTAPSDTGGTDITSWEYRYAVGTTIPNATAWTDTGNTNLTIAITGLAEGTQYAVEVRGVNAQGSGASSGVSTFRTDGTVPDASTGLMVDDKEDDSVDISWMDGDDGGSPITGHQYRITTGTSPGGTPTSTGSTSESHTISGLNPSTEYTVQVRSVNNEGNSAWSNSVTFTTETEITLTANPTSVVNSETSTVTVQLSATATDFVASDITVTGGTKGTFTAVDGDTYRLVVTAPATGTGNITVRVPADAVSAGNREVSITIAYEPDPDALSIEAIDEQNIPLGTEDYELRISIGNIDSDDGDRAYIDGDMEGFYHFWDNTNSELVIAAEDVTRLLSGAVWNVHLVKGSDSLDAEIIYNVVPVGPVFTDPGSLVLYKGIPFAARIGVANDPKVLRGTSLLVGVKSDKDENDDGDQFLLAEGMLPTDTILTEDSFMMQPYAENDGGSDTIDVPVTISNDRPVYLFNDTTNVLLRVNHDGTLAWTYEAETANYQSPVSTTDAIYLRRGATLYKVNIADGMLAWTYDAPTPGIYLPPVATADAVYFFDDTRDELWKINASDGALEWTYNAPTGTYENRFVATADGVYLFRDDTDDLLKVNFEGTLEWTYNAPTANYQVPISTLDAVYLIMSSGQTLRVDPDGTLAWTYNAGTFDMFPTIDAVYCLMILTMIYGKLTLRTAHSNGRITHRLGLMTNRLLPTMPCIC